MYNFCTLFDKRYLYRGLALYDSLLKHCPNFDLWVLCLDNETFGLLEKMHLAKIKLIRPEEFENEALKKVKKERTSTEYSWTCAANLCWFMLDKINNGELITYLDADMYFFADPADIFNEIDMASIGIIEHRLKKPRQVLEKYVGRYNVGWVSFRKDDSGSAACEWWKDKVLDWCFAYFKDGMIGDQHYLNDWTERFKNVCVIRHEGADVAPWNVNNLKITKRNGKVLVGGRSLIFYHFHNFSLITEHLYIPVTAYHIPGTAKRYIYAEYFKAIWKAIKTVSEFDPNFHFGFKKKFLKSYIVRLLFRSRLFEYLYIRYSYYKLRKTALNST